MTAKITDLGAVMQLAYVPDDFDATLDHWVRMGAGPFFIMSGSRAEWARNRGKPSDPVLTVALGHWGDMQIEIIRQDNDEASPYKEWRDAGGEGLHHVCIVVDDIGEAKRVCAEAGGELMFNGAAAGAEWIYVDSHGGPGSVIEIIQHSEQSAGLMAMIRSASQGWDGTDPVRHIDLG